ncbi:hypothetical protein V6N13_002452 [Hibiscus sabdariffa]|uniref:Clp R domain-containing protein n=1 Tax=Hibiscus sabdariffa TaxID=183260 RepID=A0ABR2C374_9ROSI
MARVVALPTAPTHAHGHAPSKETEKPKRSVKMACGIETPLLRIRSDSISSGNKLVRFGHDFRSPITLSPRPGSDSISLGNKLVRFGRDFRSPITLSSRPESCTGCLAKEVRFEGFTGKALEAIMNARDDSRRLGHNYIGIEQILLNLIGEGTGIAAEVLKFTVIMLKDVRDQVEKISPRGKGCNVLGLSFTSIATSALVHSFEEARKCGHNPIEREHLLVLLCQRVVSGLLKDLGTDLSNIYTQVSIVTEGQTRNRRVPTLEGYRTNLTKLVGEFLEATRALRGEFKSNSKSMCWEFCHREEDLGLFDEVNKAEKVVTEVDVQDIVSSWTCVPVERVITDESARFVKMEDTLHKRVIGQDEAVKAVSRACVSLRNPKRPIASFFFYGPRGVGKSELAKALAANYFGSEEAVIRIDRLEFGGRDAFSRFIGSHPGFSKGGQLTEVVRRRPYSVLIFDGLDSRPEFLDMIHQILEFGWLLDGKGRTVDFSNTIVIVIGTSEVVIEDFVGQLGFDLDEDCPYNRLKSQVIEFLKLDFAPIMNSFDDVIVFRQLTKLEVTGIAGVMLKGVFDRLKAKGVQLHVTERFQERMVDEGYDASVGEQDYEACGAWPLCRAIRHLEDSVAEKVVAGEIKEGESVTVDADYDVKCCAF